MHYPYKLTCVVKQTAELRRERSFIQADTTQADKKLGPNIEFWQILLALGSVFLPYFGHCFNFTANFLWQLIFCQTLLGAPNMGEG